MIAPSLLQIIVIGAGLIGPRHAQHVLDNPSTDLLAIVDPSSRAKEVSNDLRTLHFVSLDELFRYLAEKDLPDPDGAIICTPNHTHAQIAALLASRGIHVLIEKPVSSSLEEAKALKHHVDHSQIKVLMGHHRRFNPFIIAAKESLSMLGEVVAVQGTWTLHKPQAYFEASPWRTDSSSGGGALLINLVHDLDLMQYLFGPIERVYAEFLRKQRRHYPNVDEGACITLRFQSGITGTFICADNVTSPFNFEVGTGENPTIPFDERLEGVYKVFGVKGTLSIPDMTLYHQPDLKENSWTHPITRKSLLQDRNEFKDIKPFDNQLNHFIDVIRGNSEPVCTIDDGISALLCIDAVVRSLESEIPVLVQSVDDIRPDFDAINVANPMLDRLKGSLS